MPLKISQFEFLKVIMFFFSREGQNIKMSRRFSAEVKLTNTGVLFPQILEATGRGCFFKAQDVS